MFDLAKVADALKSTGPLLRSELRRFTRAQVATRIFVNPIESDPDVKLRAALAVQHADMLLACIDRTNPDHQ